MRERLRVLQSIVVHKGLGSVDPIPTSDRWMNRIRYSSICVGMYRHAHGLVNSTLACIGVHVACIGVHVACIGVHVACIGVHVACMWRALEFKCYAASPSLHQIPP